MTSTKEPALAGHGGDSFTPVRRKGSVTRRTDVIVTALLLAVWLAVVIFTTTRHEYWRDEVRAWSLARAAIGLALLANTNIHVTILAFLLMVVWAWDELSARGSAPDWRRGGPLLLAAGIVALGVLLSVVVVSPPRDTVLTGFYSTTPKAFASAFTAAVLQPRAGFRNLFPSFVPWAVGHAILYLVILGLLRRPILSLAALGGLIALGVLFRVGSPGGWRHAGIFLCFLLCLYWMAADEPNGGTGPKLGLRLVEVVGYGALVAMILASVYRARAVRVDVTHEMSSSKAFGAFLNAAPSYRDAILVPEPDYYIESLLYYAHNPIYLGRERRFGNTVAWSSAASAADLSLGQLVWARPGCFTTSASPGAPGSARTPSGRGAGRGVLGCVQ